MIHFNIIHFHVIATCCSAWVKSIYLFMNKQVFWEPTSIRFHVCGEERNCRGCNHRGLHVHASTSTSTKLKAGPCFKYQIAHHNSSKVLKYGARSNGHIITFLTILEFIYISRKFSHRTPVWHLRNSQVRRCTPFFFSFYAPTRVILQKRALVNDRILC